MSAPVPSSFLILLLTLVFSFNSQAEDISSKKSEEDNMINILNNLPNGQVLESRLEQQIVTESLSRMPQPCRIVVSGPSGFNAAARGMLIAAGVSHDNITILEA